MITSMDPGEGKTTTLGNLAIVFTSTGSINIAKKLQNIDGKER